jgi:hypothetical protein
MTAHTPKTRVVQVTVTAEGVRVRMHFERWFHQGSARRQKQETTIVAGTLGLEPSDDDLARYAYAIAYWVIDPRKRHIRAPGFLRWKQLATGEDVTSEHGSAVDDRQMGVEMLPLNGGWREPPQPSTIKTRPGRKRVSAAKRPRSTAREPIIRDIRYGEHADPDGA